MDPMHIWLVHWLHWARCVAQWFQCTRNAAHWIQHTIWNKRAWHIYISPFLSIKNICDSFNPRHGNTHSSSVNLSHKKHAHTVLAWLGYTYQPYSFLPLFFPFFPLKAKSLKQQSTKYYCTIISSTLCLSKVKSSRHTTPLLNICHSKLHIHTHVFEPTYLGEKHCRKEQQRFSQLEF